MQSRNIKNEARAVFEILVRENEAMLITYLRTSVRNQAVVEDLFQETMLVAWRKLSEYDRSCPFGPWVRGIAAKLIMAHFRKAKSDIMITGSDTLEYLSQQIEHIHERSGDTWEQKIDALKHCIETLPDHYQHMIQLRYFKHQPASKISEITKVSLEAVRKRLQRARAILLDCLKRKKVVIEISK
ncbi:MAG: sigma-70 family RNA polymerase sigma factor [Planctomycetota bacterium]|jgi:RNA polymerase sigma-70 factor (ECF subfamily)